jgi:hypothetical protein
MKVSIFEHTKFTKRPEWSFSVIALTDTDGWAGVLRVMDDGMVAAGQELELIAMSEGAVTYKDLVTSAIEERISLLRTVRYKEKNKGSGKWLFWQAIAEELSLDWDRPWRRGELLETIQEWCWCILQDEMPRFLGMREVGSAFLGFDRPGYASCPRPEDTYKFYNVM